jgi:hypothetical protein
MRLKRPESDLSGPARPAPQDNRATFWHERDRPRSFLSLPPNDVTLETSAVLGPQDRCDEDCQNLKLRARKIRNRRQILERNRWCCSNLRRVATSFSQKMSVPGTTMRMSHFLEGKPRKETAVLNWRERTESVLNQALITRARSAIHIWRAYMKDHCAKHRASARPRPALRSWR